MSLVSFEDCEPESQVGKAIVDVALHIDHGL